MYLKVSLGLLLLGSLLIVEANIIKSLHSSVHKKLDEETAKKLNAEYEEKILRAWGDSPADNSTTFYSDTYKATITGKKMTSFHGRELFSYQGFKYADGPRFRPSVPAGKFFGDAENFDAIHIGLKCPQSSYIGSQPSGAEDCLYLNVYTPYHPDKIKEGEPLPVMFFIHGGAFTTGDASLYLPTRLLDRDVILVVIHYRLGAFGFFTLNNEDAPGNMGLYDQVEALKWTQMYIADFGGDPKKVTIFGESAGSASVNYMMLVEPARGMFRAVIAESGSCLDHWAFDEDPLFATRHNVDFAGCGNYTEDLTPDEEMEILECMLGADVAVLTNAEDTLVKYDRANGQLGFRGAAPTLQNFPVTPSNDSELELILTKRPRQYFLTKDFEMVPFMTGSNKQEGSFVLGLMYKEFILPNSYQNNSEYLREQVIQDILYGLGVKDDTYSLATSLQMLYCPGVDMGKSHDAFSCLTDLMGPLFLKGGSWQGANYHSYFTNESTYYYSFEFESEDSMMPWLAGNVPFDHGVTHADELMYVFDFPAIMDEDNGQQLTVDRMIEMWTNFAIYLDPTPDVRKESLSKLQIPTWTPYKFEDHHVLVISNEPPWVDTEFSERWTITMDEIRADREKNDCVGKCAEYQDQKDAYMAAMITFIVLFVVGVLAAVYFFFKARR